MAVVEKERLRGRIAIDAVISRRRLRFRFMKHDSWENALFVHWPVDPSYLAARLPRGLEPDVRDGSAWIGLVLLTERGVSAHTPLLRRMVTPIDHFGANVRTYVKRDGVPGIYFFSLECSSLLASLGARLAGIPYFPAHMERAVDVERPVPSARPAVPSAAGCRNDSRGGSEDFVFTFASQRKGCGAQPSVSGRWRLRPSGGERDDWMERARWFTERYSVYAAFPLGAGPLLLRGDVTHPEWSVQPAVVEELEAEPLLAAAGFPGVCRDGSERHVCFARGVGPVEFWMLEPARMLRAA